VIQGRRFFIGAIQDLTELQSSKERTQRLGKILEASSNEIHVFEYPGLQLLESNMASCSNLKYAPERLSQMALFDLFPESEHASLQEALNKLGNVSSNEQQFESLFRRQDNSLYSVELRLLVSKGKVGTVGVLIAQDITERQHHLEKLKSYAQRLESSNRDLQDYAFVASHDLQEPLRKIQAFGDRLKAH
jgi:two-component system sensor kinase FixL